MSHLALQHFHPLVATWFGERFKAPTEPQARGWAEIAAGHDTLIMAPTGSGKTLAAFLAGLDRLVRRSLDERLEERVSIVYVSPLKALGADVERNLVAPLRGLEETAPRFGRLLLPIRAAVRSGDSTATERARIIKHPPHILITTPESLYLLLTSAGGRNALAKAETVIVDEIHALLGNKRGAHLSLTLERLDALCGRRLQRIGLSATVEPPIEAARFLTGSAEDGSDRPCSLVDAGRAQPMDVRVEIPKETLGAVASRTAWGDIYDRLHHYLREHKTTLIFVPSRRLAERVAHDLEERFQAQPEPDGTVFTISAHHGALAKRTRQKVEQRLQKGELRAVVATASLELGIDIGDVELVCQLGSPRSLAVLRQRIGRAGHAVGGTPKGRIFATTRDELLEVAAAVRAMRRGRIDRGVFREQPLDILAQQLVAMTGANTDEAGWSTEELYALCRRAAPYRRLARAEFDQVLTMLSDGIATRRGRAGAHLHLDRVHNRVRPRRGARLAAITSGGAIPDKADYQVVEHSTEAVVGTLDEDFAIESMAGDVFLLGTTPWQVRRVENGRVRVELAIGLNAGPPFWNGEGLSRTEELSEEVSGLRVELWERLQTHKRADNLAFLDEACALDEAGANQVLDYLTEGGQALGGAIPSQNEVVAERFFDDSGAMQLIIHAPFGARINRAWGLALRKKFCRTFDFELQAAATDDAILLSLGEQHSFPLESIFGFLHPRTVEETLVQAALQSPMWETRWRWNVTRALAVLRFSSGRKTPPYLLRMRAADLLAAVFPAAAGCQDNHGGAAAPEALELPDHPLVNETKRDCLEEAMDVQGLMRVLERLKAGTLKCTARDTVAASPFSHAIIAANPYSFLDDAPLEERRTRAVSTSRPGELLSRAGDLCALDPAAIAAVLDEARPDPRDADELHDLLYTVGVLTAPPTQWSDFFTRLVVAGRAVTAEGGGLPSVAWLAIERAPLVAAAYVGAEFTPAVAVTPTDPSAAHSLLVHGALQSRGPTSAERLGLLLGLGTTTVAEALGHLEGDGLVLQGHFTDEDPPEMIQFCDRRLLHRIHRRTLGRLRADVRPVPPAQLMRFLLRWQHVAPNTRLHGPEGVLKVIEQLEGVELPPLAWEREVLPARVDGYRPEWLDELCFSGEVAWARLRLRDSGETVAPTAARHTGRVSLFLRAHAPWLLDRWPVDAKTGVAHSPSTWPTLSSEARTVAEILERRGAAFVAELGQWSSLKPTELDQALWELTKAGAVAADGFSALRALLTPPGAGPRRAALGRWSLLHRDLGKRDGNEGPFLDGSPVELAMSYLRRYGIVMRAVLGRETAAPPWRDLVAVYRRLEARGEIRGGRFVTGLTGEQFALPEAVDALQALSRVPTNNEHISVAAVDPLNLVGVLTPGSRVPAVLGPSHRVVYQDGVARPGGHPQDDAVIRSEPAHVYLEPALL